jgi:predicted AAA+ superfamily ATPase
VSESLAGRAAYTTLWPLTRREQLGQGRAGRWEDLLSAPESDWAEVLADPASDPEDWKDLARRGGYPTPSIDLASPDDRRRWFQGYMRTYLERDLQELSSISSLPDFRRVMRAAAQRAGQMLNQAELSRDVGTPGPTVHRWLNLMEVSYQLLRLPAYAVNRTRRLIRSPKIYWSDVGMALFLGDDPEPAGAHLENLVLLDLLAWRDGREQRAEVLYWRTTSGAEVDFVIEAGGRLLPIEVKATRRPRPADAVHLRTFREEYGEASLPGLLLHGGDSIEWMGKGILAAPWWAVV